MNVFETLVAEMRKAQRNTFIKATPESLNKAKALENQVDKMINAARTTPKSDELGFDWPFPTPTDIDRVRT